MRWCETDGLLASRLRTLAFMRKIWTMDEGVPVGQYIERNEIDDGKGKVKSRKQKIT